MRLINIHPLEQQPPCAGLGSVAFALSKDIAFLFD
jgi:hypothetical protein